jgi:hypothetical protein
MTTKELTNLVTDNVKEAKALKDKHVVHIDAPVNYACIFSQSATEYDELLRAMEPMGAVVQQTPSGLLFRIQQLQTVSGPLQLLKIRRPDTTRPERGDADFTIKDLAAFENTYLPKRASRSWKNRAFT